MYLSFIKDLFKTDDLICVVCGSDTYKGHLLKISDELIAIKTNKGIVIKKDSDITDIYTQEQETSSSDVDSNDVVQTQSENSVFDSSTQEELKDEDLGIVEEEKLETEPAVEEKERETELSETLTTEEVVNDKKEEVEQTPSFSEKPSAPMESPRRKPEIYRIPQPTPQLKILGKIDLSTIEGRGKRTSPKGKESPNSTSEPKEAKTKPETSVSQETKKESEIPKVKTAQEDPAKMERYINGLIQNGKALEAINKIDELLTEGKYEGKQKSSLLLKKAQTFSALSEYELAKTAYQELISYNESIK